MGHNGNRKDRLDYKWKREVISYLKVISRKTNSSAVEREIWVHNQKRSQEAKIAFQKFGLFYDDPEIERVFGRMITEFQTLLDRILGEIGLESELKPKARAGKKSLDPGVSNYIFEILDKNKGNPSNSVWILNFLKPNGTAERYFKFIGEPEISYKYLPYVRERKGWHLSLKSSCKRSLSQIDGRQSQ